MVTSLMCGRGLIPLGDPGVFELRHLTRAEHLPAGLSDHGSVVDAEPGGTTLLRLDLVTLW